MIHARTTALAKYIALAATPCAMADIHYEDLGLTFSYNENGTASLPIGPFGSLFPQEIRFERDIISSSSGTSGFSYYTQWNRVEANIVLNPIGTSLGLNNLNVAVDGDQIRRMAAGELINGDVALDTRGILANRLSSYGTVFSIYYGDGTGSGSNTITNSWAFSNPQMSNLGRFYIGFEVDNLGTQFNYGWLEIELTLDALILHGYAYADSGESISAGQIPAPGVLGLLGLAAGASGMRRKRQG